MRTDDPARFLSCRTYGHKQQVVHALIRKSVQNPLSVNFGTGARHAQVRTASPRTAAWHLFGSLIWKEARVRVYSFICGALVAMTPAAGWADDPIDPAMRSADARARDREMTRQLNLDELERVRQREARYPKGTHAERLRDSDAANEEYAARSRDYERAMARYTDHRARYEQDKASWRRAVAACRAGDYSACE